MTTTSSGQDVASSDEEVFGDVVAEVLIDANANVLIKGAGESGIGDEPEIEGKLRGTNVVVVHAYTKNPCHLRIYWTTSSGKKKWKDIEVPCPPGIEDA